MQALLWLVVDVHAHTRTHNPLQSQGRSLIHQIIDWATMSTCSPLLSTVKITNLRHTKMKRLMAFVKKVNLFAFI